MLLQFSKYIEDKLSEYISAYREGFSIEMVLLGISDNILMSMDSKNNLNGVHRPLCSIWYCGHRGYASSIREVIWSAR